MSQDEIDFDEVFKGKGGLYPANLQPKTVNSPFELIKHFLAEAIRRLKKTYSDLPDIYFNFINSNSLNASVALHNGKYYMGINVGVYFLVQDMFMKMFATRTIQPEIGKIEEENTDEKKLSAYIDEGGIAYYHDADNVFFPKDWARYNFAFLYVNYAMKFLIYHELGHIVRGHVAYKTSVLQSEMWSEFEYGPAASKGLPPEISQTLEMDADSFATNRMYISIEETLRIVYFSQGKDPDFDNKPFFVLLHTTFDEKTTSMLSSIGFSSFKQFYKHWVFAIYCLFRLFRFEQFDDVRDRKLSHPPATVRITMIFQNLSSIFQKKRVKEAPEIIAELVANIKKAEDAFTTITYQENSFQNYANTVRESEKFVSDILRNWNNVRPLLEPFAFGILPPMLD